MPKKLSAEDAARIASTIDRQVERTSRTGDATVRADAVTKFRAMYEAEKQAAATMAKSKKKEPKHPWDMDAKGNPLVVGDRVKVTGKVENAGKKGVITEALRGFANVDFGNGKSGSFSMGDLTEQPRGPDGRWI